MTSHMFPNCFENPHILFNPQLTFRQMRKMKTQHKFSYYFNSIIMKKTETSIYKPADMQCPL